MLNILTSKRILRTSIRISFERHWLTDPDTGFSPRKTLLQFDDSIPLDINTSHCHCPTTLGNPEKKQTRSNNTKSEISTHHLRSHAHLIRLSLVGESQKYSLSTRLTIHNNPIDPSSSQRSRHISSRDHLPTQPLGLSEALSLLVESPLTNIPCSARCPPQTPPSNDSQPSSTPSLSDFGCQNDIMLYVYKQCCGRKCKPTVLARVVTQGLQIGGEW
jgi:hypothetical protein